MKRYNVFYQVHKGLRTLLYQTAILLQQTDFTHEEQAGEAAGRLTEVIRLFDKHAHTEDHFILPLIAAHEPSVSVLFEAEHERDHQLGSRLSILLNRLAYVETTAAKEETGQALCVAFNEFIAFNLAHMAKEEKDLNRLLWTHFADADLQGITMEIVSKIPFDVLHVYNTWMMRALSNNEISGWLKQIKDAAPDEVFSAMMQLAEAELPADRFQAITSALTEGALLA
jgi:hypothetical protein